MILSSSHYLIVNVPHIHLLFKYRPQLDISLPPKDDPKFLACCLKICHNSILEFPHHPLETNTPPILNGPTSGNPVDLNQLNVEAR
jgi:hypothetical protein